MKDFLKQDIQVGDTVVYGSSRRGGGLYGPYKVESLGAKTCGVLRYKYGGRPNSRLSQIYPDRLIVVNKIVEEKEQS